MDNPGHSIFGAGSLNLDGITAKNEEEDLQREEEEEEENRRREQEIQDLLVNAFDDLEEEESYTQHSGHPYSVPGGDGGGGGGGGEGGITGVDKAPPTPLSPLRQHQHTYSPPTQHQSIYSPPSQHQNTYTPHHYQHNMSPPPLPQHQNTYSSPHIHHQDTTNRSYHEYQYRGNHHQEGYEGEGHFGSFQNEGTPRSSSSSTSVTPWSEGSRSASPTMFHPIQGHETVGNDLSDPTMTGDQYEGEYRSVEAYNGGSLHPHHSEKDDEALHTLNDEYKEAETSYAQLKLLYEVRGRELDRQMSDYAKLQFESNRDIRALEHQLSLLRSENDGKAASVKQLQILLSEKDERVKALVGDLKELQSKFSSQQEENKKLHLELETAESTISSLEHQVSEMKALDSLSRNQKLQEEFVRKLQQGNQEDKEMLLDKLRESQKEAEASQQEVKRLREELKNVRNMYDGAVMQKTEVVAKLNLTVETLRSQYEQLLQAHDSQEILKLELKVKSLEATNQNLEEQVSMLNIELKKAKEDLKSYDMAIKLGVMKEVIPEDDSMEVLSIKKALTYNDTTHTRETVTDGRGSNRLPQDSDTGLKISEELKKSLMINTAKRKEISMLREDLQEKQARIRKAASDLRDAHAEIKQLKEHILRLEMERDEREMREGGSSEKKDTQGTGSQETEEMEVENSSLCQEVARLMACVREAKHLHNTLKDAVTALKNNLTKHLSQEQVMAVSTKVDALLSSAENGRRLSAEVECLHDMLTDMRNENTMLHQAQAKWEKRLCSLEVKLKVTEKMVLRVITDPEKASEITPSLATLHRLLSDLREMVAEVKSEVQETHQEKLKLKTKLSTCQMEMEKAKDRVASLEEETASMERNNGMEKHAEMEAYQRTYLKFHEEAMQELEANVKVEYERIAAELKDKILSLARELKEAKECYIQVCEEKNQLEERLEHLDNRPVLQDSQRIQQGTRTTLSTPDSGISAEPVTHRPQQTQDSAMPKEIEALREELVSLKQHCRKLEEEKEQLTFSVQDSMACDAREKQDSHKLMEVVERENRTLQDRCKDQEAEISRLRETLSEEAVAEDRGAWKAILERQQKRMNEEKEELRTYFRNVIEELQQKYTQVGTSQLLEEKVKEQDSGMKALTNKIKELENVIATTTRELKAARDRLEMQEDEREREVQKLTDMIQNKEDEAREKREQCDVIRQAFQKYLKKADAEHNQLTDKLDKMGAELKEKERKYMHLKVKFKKYNEVRSQNKYYKEELVRLFEEFATSKAAIVSRMKGCLEEVKGVFVGQVEVVKEVLSGMEASKESTEALNQLNQLIAIVKNFEVLIV